MFDAGLATANIYAVDHVTLAAVDYDTLRNFMSTNPAIGYKIVSGLMGELAPTLDRLRTESPGTRMVLGWRDILDGPAQMHAEWRKSNVLSHIDRWYDEVWVFGDPALFDVREEYDLPRHIGERVRYVGYLSPNVPREAVADARAELETLAPGEAGAGPIALITVGGGEDGARTPSHDIALPAREGEELRRLRHRANLQLLFQIAAQPRRVRGEHFLSQRSVGSREVGHQPLVDQPRDVIGRRGSIDLCGARDIGHRHRARVSQRGEDPRPCLQRRALTHRPPRRQLPPSLAT